MSSDSITSQLAHQLTRCRAPRRHTAITRRWARSHAALAGLSIDDIVDCCRQGTLDQNPIISALITLHQSGDDAATTVLLTVCKPVMHGMANYVNKCKIKDIGSSGFWAALGHVLATIDPCEPVDDDGQPTIFLKHIASSIYRSRGTINASNRRHQRYGLARGDDESRLVRLTKDIVDEEHRRRYSTDITAVEDAALCSIEIERIAKVVRGGFIDIDKWQHLVEHRIGHHSTTTTRERVAIHRTAQRLSRLVGHAA